MAQVARDAGPRRLPASWRWYWLLATAGIATRMWLEGRPPITNLYSSALFIGWGAVALCLILEAAYRNAIGSVAAGLIGFATLVIAHHLSLSGDTLEMMRAVLDSNFWLATHVVAVTTGYAATFLAGFLALIYLGRGVFTRSLDGPTAAALTGMVYGIVCFATLFSFVGTVLGGIWADQSCGRFWVWDPKENGALMIVLWNAFILHARWGGLVRQRGTHGTRHLRQHRHGLELVRREHAGRRAAQLRLYGLRFLVAGGLYGQPSGPYAPRRGAAHLVAQPIAAGLIGPALSGTVSAQKPTRKSSSPAPINRAFVAFAVPTSASDVLKLLRLRSLADTYE